MAAQQFVMMPPGGVMSPQAAVVYGAPPPVQHMPANGIAPEATGSCPMVFALPSRGNSWPLEVIEMSFAVDIHIATAFVSLRGSWRYPRGVPPSDCLLAMPMDRSGALMALDAQVGERVYATTVVPKTEAEGYGGKGGKDSQAGGQLAPPESTNSSPDVFHMRLPAEEAAGDGLVRLRLDRAQAWGNRDLVVTYAAWSPSIEAFINVQQPSEKAPGAFCLTVFVKSMVFVLDRSGSMQGRPMQDALEALRTGVLGLRSTSLLSTMSNCTGHHSCNLRIRAIKTALAILQLGGAGTVPYVFLITDGAVDNEREICRYAMSTLASATGVVPRISCFGIGIYCNHFFLKMLAQLGRGLCDIAYNPGKLRGQMERLLVAAATPVLTDVAVGIPGLLHGCEVYPNPVPDLFCGAPLLVAGRFVDAFPQDDVTLRGRLPNGSILDVKANCISAGAIPLDQVRLRQRLDLLTAQSWLDPSPKLVQQVVDESVAVGVPCEYTTVVGFQTTLEGRDELNKARREGKRVDVKKLAIGGAVGVTVLGAVALIGFGSVAASLSNLPIADAISGMGDIFSQAAGCCGDCGLPFCDIDCGGGDCSCNCCDEDCLDSILGALCDCPI
eukprot:jgi/Chlat1/1231/Chrsp115S01679